MIEVLARNWWVFLIRGAAAILFGIAVLLFPITALNVLVLVLAAYLFVDGIFAIMYALQNRTQNRWWMLLLTGILSIIAGIGAFVYPGLTSLILLNIVAFWAILTGVMTIIYAIEMRKLIENELWLGLSGALSVLFGILLIVFPGGGLLTLLWLVGIYGIAFGIFEIIFAFRLKSRGDQSRTTTPA